MALPIPTGNCPQATEGEDVNQDQLMDLLRQVVQHQTGITLDPQIQLGAQQNFAACQAVLQQTLTRFNDGAGFAGQESKQGFLLQEKIIGANMLQLLEQDGLSNLLAQLKASGNFPPNTNVQPAQG